MKVQARGELPSSHHEKNELNEHASPPVYEDTSPQKERPPCPPEIQALFEWFTTLDPPSAPFHLEAHQHIVDPVKFFMTLRREIEASQTGPRAKLGTLQSDLQKLRAYFANEEKAA